MLVVQKKNPIIDVVRFNSTSLTSLQKTILSNRVNMSYLEQFNYDIESVYDSKFDPIKSIHLLPDIQLGGSRIASAIKNNLHILSVFDMDCDGITSGAVIHTALRDVFKVPSSQFKSLVNRRLHGNGFNPTLVQRILAIHKEWKVDIIITSDHGSSDNQAYKILKENGIQEIIVTDHHTIPKNNYPTYADVVINPHREDSTYYKDVSGCFVAYITMLSTMKELTGSYNVSQLDTLLPYVAISTVSDVMNLSLPINRQVLKVGLTLLNSLQNPVFLAIKKVLKLSNRIDSKDIGFKIAPLLNTANRVNQEPLGFELLITEDKNKAIELSTELNKYNIKRKKIQKTLLQKAEIQRDSLKETHSIVISLESPYAINGIVAGNLGGKYNLPTVCFIDNPTSDKISGSGRGIVTGVSLIEIYNNIHTSHPDILIKFGGHKLAAGCQIYKNKLELFRELFEKEVKTMLKDITIDTTLTYDVALKSTEVTPYLVEEINSLTPYGNSWERPVFKSKFKVGYILLLGTMLAKIKLIASDGMEIDATHFFNNKNSEMTIFNIKNILSYGDMVNVVFNLGIGSFNDVINFDLEIIEIYK